MKAEITDGDVAKSDILPHWPPPRSNIQKLLSIDENSFLKFKI